MITMQDQEFVDFERRVGPGRLNEIYEMIVADCKNEFEYKLLKDCQDKPFSQWPWHFIKLRALEYENRHESKKGNM